MNNLKNAEYLFEEDDYEFYAIEEIGFSHKKLAFSHKLYEQFGHSVSSTYKEIFLSKLYQSHELTQVWVLKNNAPIGLYIAVHFDDERIIDGLNTNNKAVIGGQIHLYTKPEHRSKGIAAKTIRFLEKSIQEKFNSNCAIIMQDNAYAFASKLKEAVAIPNGNTQDELNKKLIDKINNKTNSEIKPKVYSF